jgi:CDP-paratose 2-epimerase
MNIALISGANGLIGSQCVSFFSDKMDLVLGIDNDQRAYFFGQEASTIANGEKLAEQYSNYQQYPYDIRDYKSLEQLFSKYGADIRLIIHTAAQPSHDWAAREPLTDFTINANGTINLLELTRQYAPEAVFIFTSTNKVYGDRPNSLPLVELEKRWEIDQSHPFYARGIDESMNIDNTKHSVFGASKVAADIMVQEYGKYFGMRTVVFRGGCLTGPQHKGAQLHGFLSYLMKCAVHDEIYTIFGYKGKQVRDNIHAFDLVNMFWHFYQQPREGGQIYNAGGGRSSNCSIIEAIGICEQLTGRPMRYKYAETNRIGDHIWYISDTSLFRQHYPEWSYRYSLDNIMTDIFESFKLAPITHEA